VIVARFFVQEAIYDRFTRTFGEKAGQIKVGDGLDPDTQMGPVAYDRRPAAMETLIADAKAKLRASSPAAAGLAITAISMN
jgi:succinate-semialdehyde dehydrogenase / glutarate-semialdehyde dehydrogenase